MKPRDGTQVAAERIIEATELVLTQWFAGGCDCGPLGNASSIYATLSACPLSTFEWERWA
jgi:hypothetical protein